LLDAITRALAQKLGTSAFSGPAARHRSFWDERLRAGITGSPATPQDFNATEPTAYPVASGQAQPADADPWGLSEPPADPGAAASDWSRADHVADGGAPAAASSTPLLGESARGFFGSLRLLGQSRRTFLVCESEQGVLIIDQHAADERVRFDQLRRSYAQRNVRVQRLLFPERVECTELEASLIEQHAAELEATGLICSRLGLSTVAVSAVPALLQRAAPARLLRDLLSELTRSGERAFQDAMDMALATMACHAAIRAGDALSPEEGAALLQKLDAVQDFQRHCPHGRPILCTLPFAELVQRLGR
jgi:DNA mismatch repair protein MutL